MRNLLRWLLVGLVILAAKEAVAEESIMIDSGLVENGQPIRLQVNGQGEPMVYPVQLVVIGTAPA